MLWPCCLRTIARSCCRALRGNPRTIASAAAARPLPARGRMHSIDSGLLIDDHIECAPHVHIVKRRMFDVVCQQIKGEIPVLAADDLKMRVGLQLGIWRNRKHQPGELYILRCPVVWTALEMDRR